MYDFNRVFPALVAEAIKALVVEMITCQDCKGMFPEKDSKITLHKNEIVDLCQECFLDLYRRRNQADKLN